MATPEQQQQIFSSGSKENIVPTTLFREPPVTTSPMQHFVERGLFTGNGSREEEEVKRALIVENE